MLSEVGGTNNWAGMSLDEKRGIVYAPTDHLLSTFMAESKGTKSLRQLPACYRCGYWKTKVALSTRTS
jgi:hypothetical protein